MSLNQQSTQELCDSITQEVTKLCQQKLNDGSDFTKDSVVRITAGGEEFVIQINKINPTNVELNDQFSTKHNLEASSPVAVIQEKENDDTVTDEKIKKVKQEPKVHQCEECVEVFTSFAKLRKHRIAQHKQRAFECSVCSKTFNKRSVLDRHLIIHEPVKNFPCLVCTKPFRDQRSLDEHSSVHTGEKPFQCPHCSRFFRLKKNMRLHMRIHTGERPYLCALCAKSFRRSEDFRAHMHTHNRDQRFSCDLCGKAFGYRASLRRHMKGHKAEKAFNCEYCGKSFHRRDRLNGHVRVHTGEKPYQCDECGKCFKERTHLKTHCRLLHSSESAKKKKTYTIASNNILDRVQTVHVVEQDKSGISRLKPINIATGLESNNGMGTIEITTTSGEEGNYHPVTVTYTQMKRESTDSEVAINESPLQINQIMDYTNLQYQCGGCGSLTSSKQDFDIHVQQCIGIPQGLASDQVLVLQHIES